MIGAAKMGYRTSDELEKLHKSITKVLGDVGASVLGATPLSSKKEHSGAYWRAQRAKTEVNDKKKEQLTKDLAGRKLLER
jgi:hypothetical protein